MSNLTGDIELKYKKALEGIEKVQKGLKGLTAESTEVWLKLDDAPIGRSLKKIDASVKQSAREAGVSLKDVSSFGKSLVDDVARETQAIAKRSTSETERLAKRSSDAFAKAAAADEAAAAGVFTSLANIGKASEREVDAFGRALLDDIQKTDRAAEKSTQQAIARRSAALKRAYDADMREAQKAADAEIQAAKKKADAEVSNAKRGADAMAREYARGVKAAEQAAAKEEAYAKRAADAMIREYNRAAKAQQRAAAQQRKDRIATGKSAAGDLADRASGAADIAGIGILGGLGVAIKQTEDYDRALRNVNSIAQLTEAGLAGIDKQLIRMTEDRSIRSGPKELASGLYDVYSVGYKGAKALEILNESARGATAGSTETAVAVDVLTGTLNAQIKGATNARQVMDSLFQTVNDGKVNFPQLAGAIGQTLPFLKSGGVSLQEYGAYMADATAKSQKAEFATNNLNNLIVKLADPPKEAAKAFDQLGIKYGFAELKSVGFTAKMAEIIQKTKGSDDALKALFPDMQAFTAAQTIANNKMAGFNAMAANQAKAMDGIGATARAAAKQNTGLAYEMDKARQSAGVLGNEVGKNLVPEINKLLREATAAVRRFNSLDKTTQSNIVHWTLYAGVAFLLVGRLKSCIETVILLRKVFIGLTAAMEAAAIAEGAAATGATKAGVAAAGAAISVTALSVAAGVATIAIGLTATAHEKYAEKAARVSAANADLKFSTGQVERAFHSLANVDGAAKTLASLRNEYDRLKGSISGLQKFTGVSLPAARQAISISTRITAPDKAQLQAQLDELDRQVRGQIGARRFKVQVEAQADRGSLANLKEAFRQTYGQLYDLWKLQFVPMVELGKWGFGQISYVARASWSGIRTGFGDLRKGLSDAWYELTGGFDSSFNQMLRGIGDGVTTLMGKLLGQLQGAWNNFKRWYLGQSGNSGETDGPGLPAVPDMGVRKPNPEADRAFAEENARRRDAGQKQLTRAEYDAQVQAGVQRYADGRFSAPPKHRLMPPGHSSGGPKLGTGLLFPGQAMRMDGSIEGVPNFPSPTAVSGTGVVIPVKFHVEKASVTELFQELDSVRAKIGKIEEHQRQTAITRAGQKRRRDTPDEMRERYDLKELREQERAIDSRLREIKKDSARQMKEALKPVKPWKVPDASLSGLNAILGRGATMRGVLADPLDKGERAVADRLLAAGFPHPKTRTGGNSQQWKVLDYLNSPQFNKDVAAAQISPQEVQSLKVRLFTEAILKDQATVDQKAVEAATKKAAQQRKEREGEISRARTAFAEAKAEQDTALGVQRIQQQYLKDHPGDEAGASQAVERYQYRQKLVEPGSFLRKLEKQGLGDEANAMFTELMAKFDKKRGSDRDSQFQQDQKKSLEDNIKAIKTGLSNTGSSAKDLQKILADIPDEFKVLARAGIDAPSVMGPEWGQFTEQLLKLQAAIPNRKDAEKLNFLGDAGKDLAGQLKEAQSNLRQMQDSSLTEAQRLTKQRDAWMKDMRAGIDKAELTPQGRRKALIELEQLAALWRRIINLTRNTEVGNSLNQSIEALKQQRVDLAGQMQEAGLVRRNGRVTELDRQEFAWMKEDKERKTRLNPEDLTNLQNEREQTRQMLRDFDRNSRADNGATEFYSDWSSAFQNIRTEGVQTFDNLFAGLLNRWQDTMLQMASDKLWKQLGVGDFIFGLFGGKKSGAGAALDQFREGPMKLDGSYSTGLDTVPRDMVVRVHRNESILNAEDAAQYRALRAENRQMRLKTLAPATAGSGASSSAPIIHIQELHINEARDGRATATSIARNVNASPRVSRFEQRRGVREFGRVRG